MLKLDAFLGIVIRANLDQLLNIKQFVMMMLFRVKIVGISQSFINKDQINNDEKHDFLWQAKTEA